MTFSASLLACRERTSPEPIKPESSSVAKVEAKPEPTAAATRKRKRTAPPAPEKDWEHGPTSKLTPLNPRGPDGREILVAEDDTCYVAVPKKDPPKNLPPGVMPMDRVHVDCPPEMDDPAWDNCLYATLYAAGHPTDCQCRSMGGNPPPPPLQVKCPATK